jgi:hypothetical protein
LEESVGHPFGDLVTQHLSRKQGLSQNVLADGIGQDPALIRAMCNGRRLSGPQARERVVAILGWLHAQGLLDTLGEANALLEAAKMSCLDPDVPAEDDLLAVLAVRPLSSLRAAPAASPGPTARESRRFGRGSPLAAVAFNALVMIAIVGALLLFKRASRVALWEEDFDPLHAEQWQETPASALWEDLPGPGALLRENHPQQDAAKAETTPIAVDAGVEAGAYPVLLVSVRDVEPGASYTIQIFDQAREAPVDVLHEVTQPGQYIVDLVQAMGWEGPQVFTIQVWVGGESRAVTFERIAIETERGLLGR